MPRRKQTGVEYRLFITPSYNEAKRRQSLLFRLETVKEFSTFSYEIVVRETREEDRIVWKIKGLRSPTISMPDIGPAKFLKIYENLRGTYEFIISKLDGKENAFSLQFVDTEISVIRTPKKRFVEIVPQPLEVSSGT